MVGLNINISKIILSIDDLNTLMKTETVLDEINQRQPK